MQLKRIIREQQEKLKRQGLVKESRRESQQNFHRGEMDFGGSMLDLDDYEEKDVIQALKSIVEEI